MDLKILLKKYMSGTIKVEDFKLLRKCIHDLSDKDLDGILEALWIESGRRKMDVETKREVREKLQRQLFSKPPRRTVGGWRNLAVAVLIPLFILSGTGLFILSQQHEPQDFVVRAAKGQKTQIDLPDGTRVWLNSASQISYTSNYNCKNRSISLKGEAFFDVKKNDKTMFVVDVGGISVNVHGTAFNVTAYESDSLVCVSLNRGRVSIENTDLHWTIANLSPNHQITVNRNNLSSEIIECDAEVNSLWVQNRLKMDDTFAEELFRKMEHWYGVNISASNVKPSHIYSLTIKTESLREMLELINILTPIKYQINGEEVIIVYKE